MTEAQRYVAAGIDLYSAEPELVDEIEHPGTGAPPGLWLMNDHGGYLRSNAANRPKQGASARDVLNEASLGTDDFCEFIDGGSLKQLLPDDTLVITLSEQKVRLSILRQS